MHETIIVTPGAPSNATLSTSSDIIATIEDNDEGPAITFSLSPASIVEGSTIPAVLTATPSIVSGQEITLNYSLSGTADDPITFGSEAAEYLISSETLVIPANAASASIEIVSGLDDTAVEPIETIIFEFEQPENATFESGAFVTINLESDDDPVSALTATSSEVEEGGSTQLTITIDEPSSYELLVPLELTGDAMFNIDYTTNFDTEGRESVIMTPKSGQDYNSFEALEDGRLIFLNGNRIYLFDSELGSDPVQYYMYDAANNNNNMYFDYLQVSGNTIYLQDDGVIAKIEASELTDATNTSVYPTTLLTNSNANTYFSGSFFVEGEKILYQTNENWSEYKVYLKDGESDPVELYSGNQYANMLFLFNDRVYRADGQTIYELYNESYDNSISYSNANSFVLMKSYNGIAYFLIQNNNNEREIHRLDIESDIINGLNGNIGSSTLVNYQLGEEVNYVKNFTFDSAGNILLYNRVDPNNYWGVYNYQLSPQITIPAGEVSGTFTFAATDDEFYEPTEDIIITPGTPANGTLTNTTPLTIGILDNDTPPEVSFEFSNENIYEGSEVSVTLTATVDLQSGYEITIPFNMGGEANYNGAPDPSITDEYTLSAQSIVIPPNSTTGSIEISTYLNDDDLVETIESIIFVFGEIVVADAVVTNDTPTMTLNLISEDFPTIDSVPVVSETSVTEGESTSITININSAGSEDIYVPISMSGTAELNVDYAVETSAEGEESLLVDVTNNYNLYNQMGVLDDGRIVGLSGSQLTINDPAVATFNTAQLTQSYSYLTVDNNTIYVSTGTQLVQVDLTDISANIVAEEVVLTTPSNEYFEYSPSISNNTFVFNTYSNQSGNRSTYRKAGDADMQLIYTGTDCCYAPILFNDKIYQFDYWRVYELVDGELINQVNFNYGVDRSKIGVYNGEIIAMTDSNNGWQPHKIDPVTGAQTIFGGFSLGEDVVSIQQFTVKSDGNLILLNTLSTLQTNGSQETSWGIYSYNFNPVIKIEAGSTSGSLTINTINDSSFEPSETINAVVQTPTNAFINENSELEITILDNDDAPEITYALSSETITENSDVDVTLTATLSEITPFEITIPFELYAEGNSSTAEQDEFVIVDGATSIVIPANSESASISVSTDEIDDEVVEIMETIVFTFGDAQIGTEITEPAANESITLFLDSDDDPVVTSITVSPSEFGEHEFTNVEATISEPASRDVSINFGLTGTATQDLDYSFNFDGQGAESLVVTANGSYNYFDVLDDGRVVFLNSNQLIVVDPVTSESITVQLQHGYNDLEINDGNVYLKDSWRMGKLNVSNLDSAGSVSETTLFETPTNHQMEGTWDAEGNTVIFATWNTATNIRTIYKVIDENEPEVLYENPDGFDKLFYFNDLVYHINGNNLYILNEEGVFVQESYIVQNGCGGYVQSVDVYNGKVYVMYYDYCTNMNKVYHLSLTPVPYMNSDLVLMYTPVSYYPSIDYGYSSDFSFYQGNLYIQSNLPTDSSILEYQLGAQLRVLAGETSATLVINGIEDDLNAPGEETDETIDISINGANNATLDESVVDLQAIILNNEISFTLVGTSEFDVLAEEENVFLGVPDIQDASIEWGDYDRDGDQDFAIMGRSLVFGRITRVYRNDAGVFNQTPFFFNGVSIGQLKWVDYNKDGWIDLIVSGVNNEEVPSTTIYQNQDGQNFVESIDLTLPNLYKTSMDSADFDNDGDIDFVINGQTAQGEWKKYIYYRDDLSLVLATNPSDNQYQFSEDGIDGIIQIADIHNDGDQDIIGVGQPFSKVNTLISSEDNNSNYFNTWSWGNLNDPSMTVYGRNLYFMGEENLDYKFLSVNLDNSDGYASELNGVQGLGEGAIDVADYNNDGHPDLLIVGYGDGDETTLLYDGNSSNSFTLNEDISFTGFRDAAAKWIDYDNDGDLDLFLSGYGENGNATHLYRNNLLNKNNNAPEIITNKTFENLGNGRVRLSWDAPSDDFTTDLGYVIRLGTTPGGTELSNTESNLLTGERLITKSPDIFTTSYELSLNPGVYYWSVQSVDGGQKGSEFSEEQSFQLTYEWKLLNQGGIIDRSINPVSEPIVRLTDIDADNDMDLVYGSAAGGATYIHRLEDRRFNIFSDLGSVSNITDIQFMDINGDLVQDILVSEFNQPGENGFKLFNSSSDGYFGQAFSGLALADSKIRLIDINNDGIQEIIHIGDPNPEGLGVDLKVNVYEQSGGSLIGPLDISDQIESYTEGAFDFGDIDGDSDIDFVITGLSSTALGSKVYLNETIYTETIAPIFTETSIENFGSVQPFSAYESTLDFIDFDNDGDVDIALTGSGLTGVMFKILINNGQSGSALAFTELIPTGLTPVFNAKLEFGDFNGDGYADVLYSGNMSGIGYSTKLAEYDPEAQTYVDSDFDLEGIIKASVAFGDIDGDNDLDFVISGESPNNNSGQQNIIKTYLNVRNESADVISNSGGSDFGPGTNLTKNATEFIVNEKPSTPDGLYTNQLGYNEETQTYEIEFGWSESTDDHTPSSGLTYALKVGTQQGGQEIMKVDALPNGYRMTAGKGNTEHNVKWVLNLPDDTYYWSVQAIDASYAGSSFSETEVFNVSGEPTITISNPTNNEIFDSGTTSVDLSFDVVDFDIQSDGSGDGFVNWSINEVEQDPIFTDDDINVVVEDSQSYVINMELVNNDGESLDQQTSANVSFSVDGPIEDPALELKGIIDFTVPSGGSDGKAIHLLATDDISDLSIYGIGVANNGGGTDGEEYTFPSISVSSGQHILVARTPAVMDAYMDASAIYDFVLEASTSISHNGDDAIELFYNAEVIETFGDIDTDGTGQPWEYLDSWAYKVEGNWTYGEVNTTDNTETICDASTPYPFVECDTNFNVTFSVNTANITVGENGMYAGGGILGDATAYAMSDEDGNGTWTVTIAMAEGTTGNYIFLNSPNDGGDWGAKEDLAGQECSDPDNYNDRILEAVTADTTLLHCFGSCETDGTCFVSNEELLELLESGSWRSEAETAGHIGVGPSGSTNAEWWNANPWDKWETGLYDDRWSFADGVLTVDTGDDGAIFGKKAEIDAAFPDNTPYDADNSDNEYLYYIQDDYTDTFVADATNNTITFATNGNLGFFTSVAGQEFQILETTDNTIYVRNVGSEGNAWYHRLTTAEALSTVDAMVLDMRIYPNPSNGSYVTIQTPVNGVKYVEVFDITGKRLINTSLSADTLDVSSMSSGVYLVNVTVNGFKKTVKLIIR